MYDRILERPPVVDRSSAKEMPWWYRTREKTHEGGSVSKDSSGRLVNVEKTSPMIVSVRSNTGETPGSRLLQRQNDALIVPNLRESSLGGRASRDSSVRQANGENISSRKVSVRSNTGETPVSRPLQYQEDALMVPNPRERAHGGEGRFQRQLWKTGEGGKYFPKNRFCTIKYWRDPR